MTSFLNSTSTFGRLLASFLTFVYVYLWHGLQESVLVWSAVNFAGVTCEFAAKAIGKWLPYQRLEVINQLFKWH